MFGLVKNPLQKSFYYLLTTYSIVGAPNMKKMASRFVMLLHSVRKINLTTAKPKTIVALALAHKSNDWITLG
jgi:hypothetical protein